MTAQNLPGSSDAARHGTGDADLTIMLAAHAALRRDLERLARAAAFADLPDPGRPGLGAGGWETFKRQLHLHHTAEDTIVWPALRQRLAHSDQAQSVLDAMEAEHQQIDPLLTAVDDAFARAGAGAGPTRARSATSPTRSPASLTGHLAHEERDGLPLIGVALTAPNGARVGFKIVRGNGLSAGGEMFAWLADGRPRPGRRRNGTCRRPRGWPTARSGSRGTSAPSALVS